MGQVPRETFVRYRAELIKDGLLLLKCITHAIVWHIIGSDKQKKKKKPRFLPVTTDNSFLFRVDYHGLPRFIRAKSDSVLHPRK